jgi:Na+-transporting methylmalonyl-CoA/oxaloacetate decarboxylase gamma subunit
MSTSNYLLTLCLPLLTVLLVFAIRHVSFVLQARARSSQDDAYRQLAAQAAQSQAETAAQLAAISAALARLESRTASVEQILKQVE